MNKLYVYADKNAEQFFPRYEASLKDVKKAVFFIGEDYDEAQLRIELNHIVSKGYDLICVLKGNPEFDSGINLQMGLATIIKDNENGPGMLKELLEASGKRKIGKTEIAVAILVVIAVILAAVFLVPKKESAVKADNLSLNETYTRALAAAGADSIVVDGGISEEEMLQLEVLDLSGLGIDDLKPLLYAKNLRELDISDNNITDITDLAALGRLEKLDISGNPIKDFKILEYLPNLKEIVYPDEDASK